MKLKLNNDVLNKLENLHSKLEKELGEKIDKKRMSSVIGQGNNWHCIFDCKITCKGWCLVGIGNHAMKIVR